MHRGKHPATPHGIQTGTIRKFHIRALNPTHSLQKALIFSKIIERKETNSYKIVSFAAETLNYMKYTLFFALAALFSLPAFSQNEAGLEIVKDGQLDFETVYHNDSTPPLSKRELKRLQKSKRNFHYNLLGGPSYTPDFGFLIGGSALMTFSTMPSDTTLKRSVIPASLAFMFNGGVNVTLKPQLFFKKDRFRIMGQLSYKNTLENYYGVGYSTNRDYTRSDSTSQYRSQSVQLNPQFLFRIGNTHLFAGPQIDFSYDRFTEPAQGMVKDPSYIAAGGNAHGYTNISSGVGFLLAYDTRDIPANAYCGVYLDIRGLLYEKFLGSDEEFYRLELDYRQYLSVGKRKVLAWTVQTKNAFGDVPLNRYTLSGTPFDLRGYYMGQYRDKSSHLAMVEYRQMFNTDCSNWFKKIVNHLGYVAWTGCGFMGPNPGRIEGVLPNFGVGLRIEVQPRMNIRLDLGRNTINGQNLFYFNMTEAF